MAGTEVWKWCDPCRKFVRPDNNKCPLCRQGMKKEEKVAVTVHEYNKSGRLERRQL